MSRHQPHRSRNERSRPLHHSHRDFQYGKKKVTTKNLAATLGMMGLAVGATLLVEGGPWKSRMAAAATVVGMEQVLERTGFFDGKEGKGVERRGGRRRRRRRRVGGRGEIVRKGVRGMRGIRTVQEYDEMLMNLMTMMVNGDIEIEGKEKEKEKAEEMPEERRVTLMKEQDEIRVKKNEDTGKGEPGEKKPIGDLMRNTRLRKFRLEVILRDGRRERGMSTEWQFMDRNGALSDLDASGKGQTTSPTST
ncbi:hypothetical protein DID88_007886 [Monilinia fructigena]|uniref:Uncharacterized protein n=1 Tax=Monilinia fructigena TaxID=38457 RepID=A0A395J496_9HELO|nr:hypothetical protein DID88_007886 [Monilinia fructigena]